MHYAAVYTASAELSTRGLNTYSHYHAFSRYVLCSLCRAIANGAYDYQLRVFANAAKADGRKIYVRYVST
jgi:uncharacterized CHY-type Zn-finger protein